MDRFCETFPLIGPTPLGPVKMENPGAWIDYMVAASFDLEAMLVEIQKRINGRWRVGSKNPLNVYEGERSICQCHNPEDAARIVASINADLERRGGR